MIEAVGPPNPGQMTQMRASSGADAEEAAARSAKAKDNEPTSAVKAPNSSEARREEDNAIQRETEHQEPAASAKALDESVGRNIDIRA